MPSLSPNMNLEVPLQGDLTPTYANNFYGALNIIDAHDHSSGNGAQITPTGININQDFPLNGFNLTEVRSVQLVNNGSNLSEPSDLGCVYEYAGDLWYNNAAGGQVQITSGGGISFSAAGGFGGDYVTAGAAVNYDDTHKQYDFYQAGGVVFCDIQAGSYSAFAASPFLEVAPTSGHKWRAGTAADSRFVISCDIAGSGTTNNNRYSDMDQALCIEGNGGSNLAVVGIGCYASSVPVFNSSVSVGLAWYANLTGSSSFLPYYSAAFINPSSPSIMAISGEGTTGHLSAPYYAGVYLGLYNTGAAGVPDWSLGVLNGNVGTARDFQIGSTDGTGGPALYIKKSNSHVGILNSSPNDALDVTGDVRATGGFKTSLGLATVASTTASQTAVGFFATGSIPWSWYAPFSGSIVGISAENAANLSISGGTITFNAAVNGSAVAGTDIVVNSSTANGRAFSPFAKDTFAFNAGDAITLQWTTNSAFSAANSAFIVSLTVEF